MTIQKYTAFVKTVECGSFTKAALALNYTQSGISILPELILQRIPYRITALELEIPAFRKIGIAMRDAGALSLAVKRFLEYLPHRTSHTGPECCENG